MKDTNARRAGLRRHWMHIRPRHRPGTAPGSLEVPVAATENASATPATITLFRYGKDNLDEQHDISVTNCQLPSAEATDITWIHIQGPPTPEQLKLLGDTFKLHPLALEDVVIRGDRPKFEPYENHQFTVLNHMYRDNNGALTCDQINFFLGENWLISIDEGQQDAFNSIRKRLRDKGRLRERHADFLLYALMDVIIDSGFPLLEEIGEELEELEDEILDHPSREVRNRIHYAKRELTQIRRALWPHREVITSLVRDEEEILSDTARLYLRDCNDHCVIVMDYVETYRETISSLLDTYISTVSQRMNDIMKALTIIATIFLPLSFVAGLYGMNFNTDSPWNMPELSWYFGYFYALGIMLVIALGMLIYFRHKRWL